MQEADFISIRSKRYFFVPLSVHELLREDPFLDHMLCQEFGHLDSLLWTTIAGLDLGSVLSPV
jgi:hypothetical protein